MCAAGVAPRQARQRGAYAPGGIRQKLSPIATGPIPSKRCGRILEKAFQSDKLIAFLWALINDAGRTVFLIRDNLRVHYSSEHNPEEQLDAGVRQALGKKIPVRTRIKLREDANAHLTLLERSPERVRSYFRDPHAKCAA